MDPFSGHSFGHIYQPLFPRLPNQVRAQHHSHSHHHHPHHSNPHLQHGTVARTASQQPQARVTCPYLASQRGELVRRTQRRPPQQPKETSEQLDFRRNVLRYFKCPFKEEDACRFEANPGACLFSHEDALSSDLVGEQLKEVPPYVCIYQLVNSCHSTAQRANGSSSGPTNQTNNRPCLNGLHLSVEEMVDLAHYERTHKSDIRRFYGKDAERQCGICWDRVLTKRLSRNRRFAILEKCAHCFCAGCIEAWRGTDPTKVVSCPMCRTESANVLYRRRFVTNEDIKRKLFQDRASHSTVVDLMDPFKNLIVF